MPKLENAIFYLVRATHDDYEDHHWLCKSRQEGRGRWVVTSDRSYAEKMTLPRAKSALKAIGVRSLAEDGVELSILKVEATYKLEKVFPLSPLEALARQSN